MKVVFEIVFSKNACVHLPLQKSCLKHINAPLRWGVQKMRVYSKCTLFKIITPLRFALLYVRVQGQSLSVDYIRLSYQH